MKLQVITTLAVISGILTTTSADAGKFNLGQALQTAQQISRTVNTVKYGGGQPKYKTLPYFPGKGGNPGYGGKPGYGGNPGYGGYRPGCKQPPVYKPLPQPYPGHHHPPVCKPPVNRPPVKCFTLKLINDAGAEVYVSVR